MKSTKDEMLDVEKIIGQLLRIGVFISVIIMVIGMILLFATGKSGYPANSYPVGLSDIIDGCLSLKPFALMMLGLFCLILTPVLRVLASIIAFAIEKDYLYVAITILVLLILVVAIFVGHHY
ncbi:MULTISPECIES: DUF1634 domain-containing protein [unclassified Enterococcus]|uniref:DUF1634 domain-containing protein n=1 Tax=unclassified Enterococcus TaxID=2608891 RepID=UPI0015546278|nr:MULTISPECIES: DUF1634 domain-containing protein [unclassified Enterococcus]MBS7576324.1 DUF1634 domain-containing protein [Enterococcus sp. MMGLQ5-2]MBS7583557.1 DUF1634 domain-containing protein [Enterococcus sp. MMGLQ5-1]NPD11419.1 DUF1634 domain-containing protein [Enterococcus sp. MMGLQ5-1]NPD36162.1 DUF1634 domain-containing protein [Enterococcus sp. MMGLQ5-2]